ncbi:hypothetical protein A3D84_05515 [Candidatus Woesebacteria bacterium RIFCSPHIGHO2_02_FULL_42_20]|nr:MAG: hypothetical protein A2873_04470 [Candidatus Woesebacteria bacterium RIFCSPHIGHO2_01_FULL_42_80]OGM35501.1 MAG: hypothetical protein A3D84_05515 [Candidatus Woesebacteria bacterium RIFCSPHIGHO2_02_FULL_42_20]OGM65872.1 MAG: hypothetical protein A2969_05620 [Candidatus Woesebacteria bacterium RIFCSPLOWO2_01_FULL_42_67]OGM70556.1 MAG: hypothetical protein A3I55_02200 [Candidatus Woesebacteria bacterium RIFCSPLOWO2_02_FULL_42_10]OGM72864.1 MAG: hypothetical protein A3H21_02980 [Candidatus 
MLKKFLRLLAENKLASLLIFLGSLSWSIPLVKSGIGYDFGVGFWGPNGHDGIWHIALANSLARGSWEMPVFAGSFLQNYHIGFDLLLALAAKISGVSTSIIYFQIVPPVLAILVGLLTYRLVATWKKSKKEALWSVFFVYFGGSFGWLVTLLTSGQLGGESVFWSQQAVSTLINPPYALSLVLLLLGLIFLIKSPITNHQSLITIFIFGVLFEVKAYAGLLALFGLFVVGVYEFVKNRDIKVLKIFSGSFAITLSLYLFLNRGSQDLLVFQPFWFLENLMSPDRLNWSKLGEALVNWRLGGLYYKSAFGYVLAFILFVFGNLGTRLVSIFSLSKRIDLLSVFIWAVILAGITVPMVFLQKGTSWNTIQFFYYSLFLLAILSGVGLVKLGKLLKVSLVYAVVLLVTLPTTFSTLYYHYLPGRPPAKISTEELRALDFLKDQPEGVVLTYPFDREAADAAVDNPPRPLYLYESTAYVSAYTDKPVFLEDEVNLDITGYGWSTRREEIVRFFSTSDQNAAHRFLEDNNIKYIYLLKGQQVSLNFQELGAKKIFENNISLIYSIS